MSATGTICANLYRNRIYGAMHRGIKLSSRCLDNYSNMQTSLTNKECTQQLLLGEWQHKQARIKDDALKNVRAVRPRRKRQLTFFDVPTIRITDPVWIDLLDREKPKGATHPLQYLSAGAIRHRSISEESYNPAAISNYPKHMHATILLALQSQFEIGWESMPKRILSIYWKTIASTACIWG